MFEANCSRQMGQHKKKIWVRHSSHKSCATHSYQYVQYFRVSRQWCSCQCLGFFNVCPDVDACNCTRGLYRHRKRESALKVDSGRTVPCRTVDSNPRQYYAWLFSRTLYEQSCRASTNFSYRIQMHYTQ